MLQQDKEKQASNTSNIAGPGTLLTVLFSFIGMSFLARVWNLRALSNSVRGRQTQKAGREKYPTQKNGLFSTS
jgi:hypothetical protein